MRHSGFSLLELLIATALLAIIALATGMEVKNSVDAKVRIDETTELIQGSRAVNGIFNRDIRSAFHILPEDFVWDPKKPDPKIQPPPPPPIPPKIVTIFQGKRDEIFFSARSHQRLSSAAPENEHHFVTYQLIKGELVRAESFRAVSLADREEPEDFRRFVLIKNVRRLEFKYFDPIAERWEDQWDTDSGVTKDKMPSMVKIDLEYVPNSQKDETRPEMQKIYTTVPITDLEFKNYRKKKKPTKEEPEPET